MQANKMAAFCKATIIGKFDVNFLELNSWKSIISIHFVCLDQIQVLFKYFSCQKVNQALFKSNYLFKSLFILCMNPVSLCDKTKDWYEIGWRPRDHLNPPYEMAI